MPNMSVQWKYQLSRYAFSKVMIEMKHSKNNWLQKTIKYTTNEQSTKYLN